LLDIVEGEVLGSKFIEELLTLVDRGEADNTALLKAERERLQAEVKNLVTAIAKGLARDTVADDIREREAQIAKLDVQLRAPRAARPDIDRLRDALHQRAAEWRETLRDEPKVARLLLRRMVGPLTPFDPADTTAFIEWEASVTPALLEGLAPIHDVASLPPASWNQITKWLRLLEALRRTS